MSKAPSMPMFWDAYLADTTHLTTEEHGAYLLLLAAMWRRNGTVPDIDRDNARILGLTPAKWRRTKERLGSLLIIENGHITQKNLQKIWKITQEKISANRANGAKGGRPKTKENNVLQKPNGFVSVSPNETIPEPEPLVERDKSLSRACAVETVDKIWALLPKRKRAGTAKAKLLKPVSRLLKAGKDPGQILIAVSRCYSQPRHVEEDGQYAPAVYSWLADGVWENWLPEADRMAEQTVGDDEWRRLLLAYHESQSWPAYAGEAPGHPDCRVPAPILERFIAWSAEQRRAA